MTRLESLQELVKQNPNELLPRYGLAMELANQGQLEDSVAAYEKVIEINPDYLAAYYHGGRALEKAGKTEESREMFTKGIQAARKIGDTKTLGELQAALDMLDLG